MPGLIVARVSRGPRSQPHGQTKDVYVECDARQRLTRGSVRWRRWLFLPAKWRAEYVWLRRACVVLTEQTTRPSRSRSAAAAETRTLPARPPLGATQAHLRLPRLVLVAPRARSSPRPRAFRSAAPRPARRRRRASRRRTCSVRSPRLALGSRPDRYLGSHRAVSRLVAACLAASRLVTPSRPASLLAARRPEEAALKLSLIHI